MGEYHRPLARSANMHIISLDYAHDAALNQWLPAEKLPQRFASFHANRETLCPLWLNGRSAGTRLAGIFQVPQVAPSSNQLQRCGITVTVHTWSLAHDVIR
jgi:hypothetical protein